MVRHCTNHQKSVRQLFLLFRPIVWNLLLVVSEANYFYPVIVLKVAECPGQCDDKSGVCTSNMTFKQPSTASFLFTTLDNFSVPNFAFLRTPFSKLWFITRLTCSRGIWACVVTFVWSEDSHWEGGSHFAWGWENSSFWGVCIFKCTLVGFN